MDLDQSGELFSVCGEGAARSVLLDLVARRGVRRILASASPLVGRLIGSLGEGVDIIGSGDGRDGLLEAELGITGAQWAVAETGTLILESDREDHRLASLLPPVHLAVIESSAILGGLGEALATIRRSGSGEISIRRLAGPRLSDHGCGVSQRQGE